MKSIVNNFLKLKKNKRAALTFVLSTCFVSNIALAQDTIKVKEMILDDILLINKIYQSKVISNQSEKTIVIDGVERVDSFNSTPSEILLQPSKSITIVEIIKVTHNLFTVKVKFNVNFIDINHRDFEFTYAFFKDDFSKGEYYRINGFLVNDIFLLEKKQIESIGIFYDNCRKVAKYYSSKNRMEKCRKYFNSTIMHNLNLQDNYFDTAPIFNSNNFGFSHITK